MARKLQKTIADAYDEVNNINQVSFNCSLLPKSGIISNPKAFIRKIAGTDKMKGRSRYNLRSGKTRSTDDHMETSNSPVKSQNVKFQTAPGPTGLDQSKKLNPEDDDDDKSVYSTESSDDDNNGLSKSSRALKFTTSLVKTAHNLKSEHSCAQPYEQRPSTRVSVLGANSNAANSSKTNASATRIIVAPTPEIFKKFAERVKAIRLLMNEVFSDSDLDADGEEMDSEESEDGMIKDQDDQGLGQKLASVCLGKRSRADQASTEDEGAEEGGAKKKERKVENAK
jgi:hypothetical protein